MMCLSKILISLIMMLNILLSELDAAKSEYAGTPTGKLLSIPADPTVNSLGGAYCAYASDLVGYEENIAGIADLKEKHLKLGYYDWLLDTSVQFIDFGMPITGIPYIKKGVAVAGFKFLSVPEFANKNDWGEDSGMLDVNDFIFSLGFATKYNPYFKNLKYGINLKYSYQGYTLDEESLMSVSSFSFDLGAQYKWKYIKLPFLKKLYIYNFRTGAAFRNFGFNTSDDSLPKKMKLGTSLPFLHSPVNQAVFLFDINKDIYTFASLFDSDYRFNFGLEYNYKKIVFVRTGFKLGYDENSFTIGVGIQQQLGSFLTMLNYSFGSHNELGHLNNAAISARFEEMSLYRPLPSEKRILVEYHYYRGMSLFVQDRIELAIKEWQEVLKIDPHNTDAKNRIEEAEELRQKDEEKAPEKEPETQ